MDFGALESCFVFTPAPLADGDVPFRSSKRRKLSPSDTPNEKVPYERLFLGDEDLNGSQTLGHALFTEAWQAKGPSLENDMRRSNQHVIDEIGFFLKETTPSEYARKIPAGLICTSATLCLETLSDRISQYLDTNAADMSEQAPQATNSSPTQDRHPSSVKIDSSLIVEVQAGQCSNLKTVLKHVVTQGTRSRDSDNEELLQLRPQSDTKLLNYDLQALHEYVQDHTVSRVVVLFRQSESINGTILAEIIDILHSWLDRIPFILLFEIATTIDLFQEKLPRASIRLLQATIFETEDADEIVEQMYAKFNGSLSNMHWLGPNVAKLLRDRQSEQFQSPHAFLRMIKYLLVYHFSNNPLSLLYKGQKAKDMPRGLASSIRNRPSFKKYLHGLSKKQAAAISKDDTALLASASKLVEDGQQAMRYLAFSVDLILNLQDCVGTADRKWSSWYIQATSGELKDSPALRDILMSARKMSSDALERFLFLGGYEDEPHFSGIKTRFANFKDRHGGEKTFRSEHDIVHETTRTTVVAQKIQLSKQKSALSEEDKQYSAIIGELGAALKTFFDTHLINPKDLPLHEAFLLDYRACLQDVFMPSPRRSIERALSNPRDYLACDCCEAAEGGLSQTQPATAILYQLYLESGALINIADLWSAFQAVLGGRSSTVERDDEGTHEDAEQETRALFYRALAELQFLGMIKNSRKRSDHLAKLRWRGI